MIRHWPRALLFLLVAPALLAQSDDEAKFGKDQAKVLNEYATKALKKGFPQQAKVIFLMVIADYDPDSEVAHKSLGHTRSGKVWQENPGFSLPRVDKPDPSAAAALRREFESVGKKLVRAHKDMAAKYEAAGRKDAAQRHYKRLLRFAPDDEDAKKALELVEVSDSLSGTAMEQEMFKRGIMLADAVKTESAKDYPVEKVENSRHPVLDRAQVEYITVKSEHFTFRGDYDEEILKEAAVWSERALRVVQAAFKGYEELFFTDLTRWPVKEFSFFKSKDTYKQIILAHQDQIPDKKRLEFILEQVTSTTIGNIGVAVTNSKKGVCDGAVRRVARNFTWLPPPALGEGIGHTFVGLLLTNNRAFIVDLEKQIGTSSGSEDDLAKFNPDIEMWEELAVEAAWKKTTLAAVQLPLIDAAKFDDNMRIKSWSFCHYLVLRDPKLLRILAQTADEKNTIGVEKKFTELAKVSLAQLDKEWKDFFTGATPVMRAIRDREDPMAAVSKDVKKWLDAINKIRTKEFKAAPVTWSASFSTRCKQHADFLIANSLSGADQEQRQDPQLPGSTHKGSMFAQMAMVSSDAKKPAAVIEEWLNYPGYRDLFFVNTLKTIGIYSEKNYVVLNVTQGLVQPRASNFYTFPEHGRTRVPNSVKVSDLGPEMKTLLERNGHAGLEVIGFPLSLHFGNSGAMGERDSYSCSVIANDRDAVQGFVHIADDGSHRRTSSPGLVVFYPIKPIRKGSKVKVRWTFKRGTRLHNVEAVYTH